MKILLLSPRVGDMAPIIESAGDTWRAAIDDRRMIAAMTEKIPVGYLVEKGYSKPGAAE